MVNFVRTRVYGVSIVGLFWTLLALNVADFALTASIIDSGGGEANPYVDWYIGHWGSFGIVLAKAIPFLLLGWVIEFRWSQVRPQTRRLIKPILVKANLAYAAVVMYSMYVLVAQVSIYL